MEYASEYFQLVLAEISKWNWLLKSVLYEKKGGKNTTTSRLAFNKWRATAFATCVENSTKPTKVLQTGISSKWIQWHKLYPSKEKEIQFLNGRLLLLFDTSFFIRKHKRSKILKSLIKPLINVFVHKITSIHWNSWSNSVVSGFFSRNWAFSPVPVPLLWIFIAPWSTTGTPSCSAAATRWPAAAPDRRPGPTSSGSLWTDDSVFRTVHSP